MRRGLVVVLCLVCMGAQAGQRVRAPKELAQLELLLDKQDFSSAFQKGRALLPAFEEAFGDDSIEVADLLDAFLLAWWRTSAERTPQMVKLAERALAIREAHVAPGDRSLARPLRQLAAILRAEGTRDPWPERQKRNLTAVAHLKRALALESVGRWAEDPQVLGDYALLGSTLVWWVSTYDAVREGLDVYERLVAILEKERGRHNASMLPALHGRASAKWRLGDFDGALRDYRSGLALARSQYGPRSGEAVSMINSLANTLVMVGDYGEALKLHETALAVEEGLSNDEWRGNRYWWISNTLNSLGLLHFNLGMLEQARAFLERGMRIEGHVESIELNLGRVLHAQGERSRARSMFEAELVKAPDSPWTNAALASVLGELGERDKAVEQYLHAIATTERDQGLDHFYLLDPLEGLARVQIEAGKLEEAEHLLLRGLAIAEQTFGPKSARVAEFVAELARLHAKTGDKAHALDEALRAESLSRDHLRLTSRSLSEREALRFGAARTSTMDLLLQLAVEQEDAPGRVRAAIWDALVRSRALVLDEMAARHAAIDSARSKDVARLAEGLSTARTRLARLVVLGPQGQNAELYRRIVDLTTAEKDRAERELAARSERFNRDLARAGVGLSDALRALPPDAILIAYGRYESEQGAHYVAFVGASDRDPAVVPLGPAARIDALVAQWRAAILASAWGGETSKAAYLEAGTQLREAAWDPLARWIQPAKRVFVVPDGTLGLVSFSALPAAGGGYVIEQGPAVHLVSAERDLADRPPPPVGLGILAMGAPEYDAVEPATVQAASVPGLPTGGTATTRGLGIVCPGYAGLTFTALPETKAEAEEVASVWAHSQEPAKKPEEILQLSGAAATEGSFKRFAPGRRVVHVATHGFFLGEDCPSALARTRGIGGLVDRENAPRPATPGDNPLLLAGLALAGANRRATTPPGAEDGVLTAEEIAGIDLSSAEWVVLSACETGVGTIAAGEGVLGLRRAVQLAGARTLIMSLWPVEDQAARAWMSALYRAHWKEGLDTVDAVRAASLAILHARREAGESDVPFFWGPFVAAGAP